MGFWQSGSGTALITVLLGGALGQFISCDVQNRLKEREFNDTWLKSRGDQALAARTEFMRTRRETFENVIATTARLANASEELLYVMSPAFKLDNLQGANRERVRAEQEKLVNAYRTADLEWGTKRFTFDFAVGYFGEQDPKVISAWRGVRSSVDKYRKCAGDEYNKWYVAGQAKQTYSYSETTCKPEEAAVSSALQQLGSTFAVRADYGWRGWDDPQQLKKALDIGR